MAFIKTWLQWHRSAHQVKEPEPDDTVEGGSGFRQSVSDTSNAMKSQYLPSRLLYIGESDSFMTRIVQKRDYTEDIYGYAALSYCWRQKEPLQLKKANVRQFEHAIPIGSFSQAHQDAIHVIRRLGLCYLWIDALCIIQDCETDKQKEIPLMHKVYACADIVILATAAWDSSESFFVSQNPLALSPCILSVRGQVSEEGGFRFTAQRFGAIYAYSSQYVTDWDDDLRYSRLTSRGWAFQEMHLARRYASFGEHQIQLYCRECESLTDQIDRPKIDNGNIFQDIHLTRPDILLFLYHLICHTIQSSYFLQRFLKPLMHSAKKRVSKAKARVPAADKSEPKIEIYRMLEEAERIWWTLVHRYSSTKLTMSKDRLPAVEGLARYLHELTIWPSDRPDSRLVDTQFSADYIAGHWNTEWFALGLLWIVSNGLATRPTPRAPSWSWASVDVRITPGLLKSNPAESSTEIEILTKPLAADNFRLRLRGVLREARWSNFVYGKQYYNCRSPATSSNYVQPKPVESRKDLEQFTALTDDSGMGPEAYNLETLNSATKLGYFIPDSIDYSAGKQPQDRTIFCLRIVIEPEERHKEDFSYAWVTRGLALLRVGDADRSVFKRVGFIELHRDSGGISIPLFSELSARGFYTTRVRRGILRQILTQRDFSKGLRSRTSSLNKDD
jgi:Heterokaryon incompatibility protein (HET)